MTVSHDSPIRSGMLDAARGIAVFLGGFAWLAVIVRLLVPGRGIEVWFVDLRPLAPAVRSSVMALVGSTWIAWGLRPWGGRPLRLASAAFAASFAVVAASNAAAVVALAGNGTLELKAPPLSAFVAIALSAMAVAGCRSVAPRSRAAPAVAWALLWAALFPLAQMTCFGTSDYRRPADAIVVLGARTYADGRASWALEDRVRTACALYRAGYAPLLVVSGGPGDGDVSETDAMTRLAVSEGVPRDVIVADRAGTSTRATARNVSRWLAANGCRNALVVSHGFDLPRVMAAFESARLPCYTVPAEERHALPAKALYVAREVVAFWAYLVDPRTQLE
jgi:uncharacterized SAM-binding protein YcdF (DUF218 family)